MKWSSNIIPALLLLLTALSSCEKDLDTRKLEYRQQPVINALFDQNSSIKVFVTLSNQDPFFSPLQADSTKVVLFEDGLPADTLSFYERDSLNGFGYFRPGLRTTAGKSYSLQVFVPGFPVCSASSYQPIPIYPAHLQFNPDTSGNKLRISFTITDPSETGNLYRVRTYIKNTFTITDSASGNISTISLRDYGEVFISDAVFTQNGFYLNDQTWNGQNRTFNAELPLNSYPASESRELVTEVLHCSPEFFNYQYDINRYFGANYELNDPVFIRSNVVNGLGIFAGSANASIAIPVP